MCQKNFKKLPYNYRAKMKWIIIVTALTVYICSIVYTKMQTKLYRASGYLNFVCTNQIISDFASAERNINFEKTIRDILYSDELLTKASMELGLAADENDAMNVIKKLKSRIDFQKNQPNQFEFTVSIVSSEPIKSNRIVNALIKNVADIYNNDYVKFIEKQIDDLKNVMIEFEDKPEFLPLRAELNNRITSLNLYFKTMKPELIVKEAEQPRKPFYTEERDTALAGLIIGLLLGVVIALLVAVLKFLQINELSFFDNKNSVAYHN